MNRLSLGSTVLLLAVTSLFGPIRKSKADFVLQLNSSDFGISSVFNQITSFEFEFIIAGGLIAGADYINPTLRGVNYRVNGMLPNATPSGFPAFALERIVDGTDFYTLSPEATLQFSISGTADLTDGLQLSELAGAGPIFQLNAREFNQSPGRYHPPMLTLNQGGTGSLINANNQSIFNNPPPPIGSGQPVDVAIGEEYQVNLTFNPNVTVVAVPEPSFTWLALVLVVIGAARCRKQKEVTPTEFASV